MRRESFTRSAFTLPGASRPNLLRSLALAAQFSLPAEDCRSATECYPILIVASLRAASFQLFLPPSVRRFQSRETRVFYAISCPHFSISAFSFFLSTLLGDGEALGLFPASCAFLCVISAFAVSHKNSTLARLSRCSNRTKPRPASALLLLLRRPL